MIALSLGNRGGSWYPIMGGVGDGGVGVWSLHVRIIGCCDGPEF